MVKTSPVAAAAAADGEPWLDPKYLPPDPSTTTHPNITPGVLKTQGATGARFQGNTVVSGKLKPATLASSYFPKS